MSDTPRAQLIHIDVDRRLGHEWDEWDGKPLPNRGNYDSAPPLFFGWSAAALLVGLGLVALALYLFAPRLADLHPRIPRLLWIGLGFAAVVLWPWWGVLFLSYAIGRPLLPERLAERGPFLRLMRLTSRVADRFGRRDWVENASVKVYNALALLRGRKVGQGRAAAADPALPVEGDARRACWASRGSTRCRCSWPRAANWRGGSSASGGLARWWRWPASGTW